MITGILPLRNVKLGYPWDLTFASLVLAAGLITSFTSCGGRPEIQPPTPAPTMPFDVGSPSDPDDVADAGR